MDFLTQHFGSNKSTICRMVALHNTKSFYATIMKILEWKLSGTFLLLPTESLCWRDPQANNNHSQPPVTLRRPNMYSTLTLCGYSHKGNSIWLCNLGQVRPGSSTTGREVENE